MKDKIQNAWGNLSIRKKLLLTMLCLVFVSVTILGGYFYYISSDIIRKNLRRNIQSTMHQVRENVNYKVEVISNILFDISTNSRIQSELQTLNTKELENYERVACSSRMKSQLIYLSTKVDAITAVFVYDLKGGMHAARQEYYPNPEYTEEEIYEKRGANLWMLPDTTLQVVPIGKAIYSLENQKKLGYLIMYVKKDYFESVFQNVSFSDEDFLFILDDKNRIILGEMPWAEEKVKLSVEKETFANISIDGETRQLYSVPIEENSWLLYSISLDESRNRELIKLKYLTVGVMSAVFILIVVLVAWISREISRPISKLAESMNAFAQGNYSTQVEVKYQDEIGQLRNSFNYMAERTNHLITEVYAERNLKQQAQINALQMQINPHFLYNTLETINWLAIEKEAIEISEVTRSLGMLMRFSLKKENKCLLDEELDAVENYIKIQQYRYGGKLHIKIHAEESCLYEIIPIHILLPLVENSVEHGLSNISGDKYIWIRCAMKKEKVWLSVCDNGVGIDSQKKVEILHGETEEKEKKHMSIGMRNVLKRLELYYGEEAEFMIKDRIGGGTVIVINIPAQIQEFEEEEDEQ